VLNEQSSQCISSVRNALETEIFCL